MNIALIIAGGVGNRTGQKIPKQFINVLDKPIIVYTLEKFQNAKQIDEIVVVCLEGWEKILEAYAIQYGISKLKTIVKGGGTSQESIYEGIKAVAEIHHMDDIVLIHDGIRPMVSEEIIDSCIATCNEKGNGITALPVYEQIFRAKDENSTNECIPRECLRILQTPQAYHIGEIQTVYRVGFEKQIGIGNSTYANTLMTELGHTLYFAKGNTMNMKITTKEDIAIFKAMLLSEE